MKQFIPVRRTENITKGVTTLGFRRATGNGKQMQIMIAKHSDRRFPQIFYETQCFQRFWPPVDDIAYKIDAIEPGIEGNFLQQEGQLAKAALHIADGVFGHGGLMQDARDGKGKRRYLGIEGFAFVANQQILAAHHAHRSLDHGGAGVAEGIAR